MNKRNIFSNGWFYRDSDGKRNYFPKVPLIQWILLTVCVTICANFACNRSGELIKCRVVWIEWIGVSDWFVISVSTNSCTKSCVVSWFSESALLNAFFLSVSENIIYYSMYLKKIMWFFWFMRKYFYWIICFIFVQLISSKVFHMNVQLWVI